MLNGPYISPVFGSKVFSPKQHELLLSILNKQTLTFRDWVFFVGRLRAFGFSIEEQFRIIDKYNCWKTYDASETVYQLRYFYKYKGRIGNKGREHPSFNSIAPPTPNYTDVDIIKLFLDKCEPWDVKPPKTIKDAVVYYYHQGASIIPMRSGEKKPYWGLSWSKYQEKQPTPQEIISWDWQYGICLLGTEKYCTLDIDIRSPKHPNGIQNFNEEVLDGWCYERTKNGGYHVFGLGKFGVIPGEAAEIRGKGGYVVTSPTEGYSFQ